MNSFIIGLLVTIVAIDAAFITPGVWGEYEACSVSCGGGVMVRYKQCGTFICGKTEATCNTFPCEDPLMNADWTPCDSTCKGDCQAKDEGGNVLATIECNGQCELAMPTCNKKVLFVVDRTGSIGFLNFVREKQFVKDLLTTFQGSVDVGLIAFSGNAITYQNFGTGNTVQQTKDQVDAMVFDGAATTTVPALEAARDIVMGETGAVVVIMADSGTNSKNGYDSGVVAVADQIKQHAKIIAIQMATNANQELAAIAPENIVQVDSPSGLSDVITDVANRICD